MLLPFQSTEADVQLVGRASRGDQAAFNELVGRYQAAIVQFVRCRLGASADAEDVAQEIFVAAWRQLPRFRGEARFRTWLFGIARNWCAETRRRQARRVESLTHLEEATERDLASLWDVPRDATETVDERETVYRWLRQLPELEREIVELYYFGDLNLREIAELTRTPLSTVKTRFYSAHHKLRLAATTEDTALLGGRK